MNGHEAVVGKTGWQLKAFRAFESTWQRRRPASHRAFRRVYNRVGPVIAGRIRSPYAADAVYLALKPVEWLAGSIADGECEDCATVGGPPAP